jgi:ferredoxin
MPYVITSGCQQCGTCAAGCESQAIEEGPDAATIDIMICVECGVCTDNCPFQAIVFEEVVAAVPTA